MPLGEIAGEAIGGVFRIIGQLLVEVVVEILIRGPGHLICRMCGYKGSPDGWLPAVVGIVFWVAILGAGYLLFVAGPT